jgi:two-component system, OmpR family, heavy metal sensor histidine kinase CusS
MFTAHHEGRFPSMRFRLTFWNTAVILLLLVGTLVGLRFGLRYTLENEMDSLLSADVEEVQLIVHRYYPKWDAIKEELDRKAVAHKATAWFVQVWSLDGKLQRESLGAPEPKVSLVDAPFKPFDSAGNRCLQRTLEATKAPAGVPCPALIVRVGCSRDFVEDDVWTLTKILFVVAGIIVVVGPLSGYWLAGWVTKQLQTILQTTSRLRPGALRERVPLRGTGDELDQMSATLNGLLDRLEAHMERQRAFVANAAHELRSPLAAVRTLAEVALNVERSPEDYRERLADILEACESLSILVNQLLLMAEGESGLVGTVNPVRLDQLVARAIDMFSGTAESRGVTLKFDSDVWATARGNETQLRHVIYNLLDNAIKFTPSGGTVTAEVRPGTGGGPCSLCVRDNGIGIPEEDLPHLFERFYRGDKSRSRCDGAGGYGLGLSICQAIVSAHGGEIRVESKLGQGTAVTVLLR